MKIFATSQINRTLDDVWKLVSDTTTWPKWAPVYLELKQTSVGPVGIGATFHSKHPQGRTLDEKLIEYQPGRRFALEFTSGPIKGSTEAYDMEETTDEQGKKTTNLTREFNLEFSGIFKVLGPILVTPGFKKEKSVEVDNVKRLLEDPGSVATRPP